MGQLTFLVILFSHLQSIHHLILPPFFLAVTRLKLQGLLVGLIMSCHSHSSNCSLRAGSSAGLMDLYRHLIGGTSSVMIRCWIRWVGHRDHHVRRGPST